VRGCAIALVLLGCFFRFHGLSSKVVWHDETHTGTAIAGSSRDEVLANVYDGRVHTRGDLLVHQFPRDDRAAVDTIRVLAKDQPRHPPLYFVLARAWVRVFGSSISALRALSAVLSLLVLPVVFLLCRELPRDDVSGWVAVGLIAISPLHIVYGQEARQYMLWVVLVSTAGWLLLRAVPRAQHHGNRAGRWFGLYAITLALALYTHLLTALVLAAHLLFVVVAERFRLTGGVRRAGLAMVGAAVLFAPWLVVLVADSLSPRPWIAWAQDPVTLGEWSVQVGAAYSRIFFQLESARLFPDDQLLGAIPLAVAAVCAVWGLRWAPRRALMFLIALVTVCSMPFVAADLVSEGWRTAVIRYQFPAVFGLQLCVALGIAHLLTSGASRQRRAGVASAVLLVTCGFVSGVEYGRSRVWWNKPYGREVVAAADVINRSPAPLLVSSYLEKQSLGKTISLAHSLGDSAQVQLVVAPEVPVIPDESGTVYAWRLPGKVRRRLAEQGWKSTGLDPPRLYRLTRVGEPSSTTQSAGGITYDRGHRILGGSEQ
jgi:uncharacterized membrane protein